MRSGSVSAIIFSNSNDGALKELTANRSIASLPFGGRYRLIDFTLSSLVNAGISKIGIITKENYRSLMDHLGSGVFWDLDRKNGGLYIIPPYISGVHKYKGSTDAVIRALDFVNHTNSEYIIVCESGAVANIDVSSLINYHIDNNSDITIVYRKAECGDKYENSVKLKLEDNGKVTAVSSSKTSTELGNFSLGLSIFRKEVFLNIISSSSDTTVDGIYRDTIARNTEKLNIFGFEHKGYSAVMDCRKSYFEANMELLNPDVRKDLFNPERPIFTKVKDDMPTRYGTHSSVSNSLIADGCIIDGTVKNSILFRGVRIRKGAVVENCVLMQGVEIRDNTKIKYVVSDKNAVISDGENINGTNRKAFIVKKNQVL